MNCFEMKIPRVEVGIAAVAMTVFCLGIAVVAPAMIGLEGEVDVASATAGRAPVEVAIEPSHIELVGNRKKTIVAMAGSSRTDLVAANARELGKPYVGHAGAN